MVATMALGLLRIASVVVDAAGPSRPRLALRRLRLRLRPAIVPVER